MSKTDSSRSSKGRKKGSLRVPSDSVPRRERKDSKADEIDVSDITLTGPTPQNDNSVDSSEATTIADGSVEIHDESTIKMDGPPQPPAEQEADVHASTTPESADADNNRNRAPTEAISEEDLEDVRNAESAELLIASLSHPVATAVSEAPSPGVPLPVAAAPPAPAAQMEAPTRPAVDVPPPPPPKKGPPPAPVSSVVAPRPVPRPRAWHDEIFNEDYLRTLPLLTPLATQNEANFVIDSLGVEVGSQILDAGCGYGRHAMELAARGYQIVGLDNSLPLLLRGAEEAQRRGLSIHFVHGDMREIQFDSQFDGAYCIFNTFGYFDDDTNKKTAQNLARSLKPGARLVVDVLNRDYVIADLPSRVWWEGEGCVVLEEVDFNYFSSRVVSNRSLVFDDGRQVEQEISIRSFSLHEIGKLLHSAGLRVLEISGSMATRGRFFGAHSRDLVVVAERR